MAINGHPKSLNPADSALTTFWKILRSYFYRPAARKALIMETSDEKIEVKTNRDGEFELLIKSNPHEALTFRNPKTGEKLRVLIDERNVFKTEVPDLMVISDIDDTILVSHSARFFSKLWLMLFRPVDKRKTVEESEFAYRRLKEADIPFAYVSASEYNLYSLVSTFIGLHDLPPGPIYLRPHQEWYELLTRTERINYKLERITKLIAHNPSRQFVLFGDDSQQDFTIFGEVSLLFPDQIHSVFLRKTGSLKGRKARKAVWEMPGGKIAVHYYDSFREIEETINSIANEVRRSDQSSLGHPG